MEATTGFEPVMEVCGRPGQPQEGAGRRSIVVMLLVAAVRRLANLSEGQVEKRAFCFLPGLPGWEVDADAFAF